MGMESRDMNVHILTVSYDSGYKAVRMGRGPEHFVDQGIAQFLRARDHAVQVEPIDAPDSFQAEIKTSFALYRSLAERVRQTAAAGSFPLVLAGNCGSAVGALAGSNRSAIGLIWFDAHGDFNTPETTTSGFLDGMGLAIMTGRCWRTLATTIPGFCVLPEAQVIHVGGRDFGPAEQAALADSDIAVIGAAQIRQTAVRHALLPPLTTLQERVQDVYLHLDLDVLDSHAVAPANEYAQPHGLTVDEVAEAIHLIKRHFTIRGGSLASYDPAYDHENRMVQAGFRLVEAIVT